MAKIPKFSDFTDITTMVNKFKSIVEQFTGPEAAEVIKEALEKEEDPKKILLLEFELLINQMQDVQVVQTKIINDLKNKYAELHKVLLVEEKVAEKQDKEKIA